MSVQDSEPRGEDVVRIEISRAKLVEIIESKDLYISDFRCLDKKSQRCVWRLCLDACV